VLEPLEAGPHDLMLELLAGVRLTELGEHARDLERRREQDASVRPLAIVVKDDPPPGCAS